MQRDIRYCTTEDNVRIAYSVSGQGQRWFVHTPNLLTAALAAETIPGRTSWTRNLEQHFRLLQYDPRGTGFSQRHAEDLSIEALVRDLEAVIEAAGVDRALLYGFIAGTYTAVWYAAAHPERVSHLALWLPVILSPDTPQFRAGGALARSDWESFTEFFAHAAVGWERGEQSHAYALMIRETVSQETFVRFMTDWFGRWGDRPDETYAPAARVQAPALCMQREGFPDFPRFAAPLANATTHTFPGTALIPYVDGGADIVQAMAAFAGIASPEPSAPRRLQSPAVQTVLFTDIVGHTEMMQRLGDAKGRDVLREHERITREALEAHGGVEIKTDGDSFMAAFASVAGAVACAVALQQAFAARAGEPLRVRIGLHAGEPIEEEGDLFGSTVILAARIREKAEAGEILISETVRGLLSGKGFVFTDRGEFIPKGFDEAVRLYEVRWRE